MGYYTNYELEVQNASDEDMERIFNSMRENMDAYYALSLASVSEKDVCPHCHGEGEIRVFTGGNTFESADAVKWYDHESEMIALSEKFPDILFVLDGEGEETDDIWRKYFKNGKMKSAEVEVKITPPDLENW